MTDLLSRIPTAHSLLCRCKYNLHHLGLNCNVVMLTKIVHFERLDIANLEWNYKSFSYSENVANVVFKRLSFRLDVTAYCKIESLPELSHGSPTPHQCLPLQHQDIGLWSRMTLKRRKRSSVHQGAPPRPEQRWGLLPPTAYVWQYPQVTWLSIIHLEAHTLSVV